jgi:hypothetical protein
MDDRSIPHFSRDDLRRISLLRGNVIDLGIAINDLDAELRPRLAERPRLVRLLREAETELATLLRRKAAA